MISLDDLIDIGGNRGYSSLWFVMQEWLSKNGRYCL